MHDISRIDNRNRWNFVHVNVKRGSDQFSPGISSHTAIERLQVGIGFGDALRQVLGKFGQPLFIGGVTKTCQDQRKECGTNWFNKIELTLQKLF